MVFCGRILLLFTVVSPISILRGSPITLSYTQYFDYNIPGIVGHPSATWTATFDSSLEPAAPFQNAPSSVNQDFVKSGLSTISGNPLTSPAAPQLIWFSGGIEGAAPTSFELGGTDYVAFPFFPLFPTPPCSLPCSAIATHPYQVLRFPEVATFFFASTPDTYVAVAATTVVPEPAFGLVIGLGGAGIVLKRGHFC